MFVVLIESIKNEILIFMGVFGEYDFWDRICTGSGIVLDGLKILTRYPIMLLPIFISWILYAIIVVYLSYYFNWDLLSSKQVLLLLFGIVVLFSIIYSVSSFILLELIAQIETNNEINLLTAIKETFIKDFLKALPIIIIWAIICFVLVLIKIATSSRNKQDKKQPNLENFAKTLGGYNKFSLGTLTLDLLNSGIRLVVFMIYPAIAWEDENTLNAVKKGFNAIKNNAVEFMSGFIQTEFAAAVIFIPIAILFVISESQEISFSYGVWIAAIIYIGIATTFYLYLQQIFAAILYLWNMKWLKFSQNAIERGIEPPSLHDIKKPNLLDNIPDLL